MKKFHDRDNKFPNKEQCKNVMKFIDINNTNNIGKGIINECKKLN